jgi:cobalt/nickel transport system ATP-binding protein
MRFAAVPDTSPGTLPPPSCPSDMPLFSMDEVAYAYDGIDALRRISFRIRPGESVALLGANGSGKSTVLRLLAGLVLPTEGEVRFSGTALTGATLKDPSFVVDFRRRVGFLFQNPETMLFCPTVTEEIRFAPLQLGREATARTRTEELLALLRIRHLADRPPYAASGGEKKKIALAAILSADPEAILLDEPMNDLDPRSRREIRDLLLELKRGGRTLIAATHDFDSARGIFDRALLLSEDHRLAARGTLEELIADEALLRAHNLA